MTTIEKDLCEHCTRYLPVRSFGTDGILCDQCAIKYGLITQPESSRSRMDFTAWIILGSVVILIGWAFWLARFTAQCKGTVVNTPTGISCVK